MFVSVDSVCLDKQRFDIALNNLHNIINNPNYLAAFVAARDHYYPDVTSYAKAPTGKKIEEKYR